MSLCSTKYWHRLEDGRVQCDVCPRFCKMHEGQRGLCYVRGVENGEVVLTSYGVASGFCLDPIEKKPLNHFMPGTPILSFGQFGCNLTCRFCQNWGISKATRDDPRRQDLALLSAEWEKLEKKHTRESTRKAHVETGLDGIEKAHEIAHAEGTQHTTCSEKTSKNNDLGTCKSSQNLHTPVFH